MENKQGIAKDEKTDIIQLQIARGYHGRPIPLLNGVEIALKAGLKRVSLLSHHPNTMQYVPSAGRALKGMETGILHGPRDA